MLVDASFPAYSQRLSTSAVHVERYTGPLVSDQALATSAAEDGYDALALLGVDVPGRAELLREASRVRITIVAVLADDPVRGEQYLANNLDRLREHMGTGTLVSVLRDEVRPKRLHTS